jgi:carbon-monoxide dehydrogenase large subunit
VEVHPDGSVTVLTGTSPHGQGHATAWAMLVNEHLDVPIEKITVKHGDTDLIPRGLGTMGSRSLQTGGVAVYQAAGELVELAKQRAADVLEASVDDLVIERGAVVVKGTDSSVTLGDLAAREALRVDANFSSGAPSFPFGAHVAVVEVDVESGKAVVDRIITVDDAGPILNPLLAEGQRHGGIAQGIAQALLEEVVYDEDGNPLTATFADYGIPSAAELPSFTLLDMATPTHLNPLGVKGIGEAGTIGATPAVQSAVIDALSHLGVRHIDMPLTPLRVWEAIEAARSAGEARIEGAK